MATKIYTPAQSGRIASRAEFLPGALHYKFAQLSGTMGGQSAFYSANTAVLNVTPDPTYEPPRMIITCTMPGATVSVTRTVADSIFPGDQFYPGGNAMMDVGMVEQPVRFARDVPLYEGVSTIYDYEMPFGENMVYTAYSNTGTSIQSAPTMVTSDQGWLLYPGNPSGSRRIRISSMGDLTRAVNRGVFTPLGRRDAVVVSDRRRSAEGSLVLYTDNQYDRDGILDLTDLGAVLLLNVPPTLGYDIDWQYISIGDVVESRATVGGARLSETSRLLTLPYTVTGRPVGLEQTPYTWYDVLNGLDTQSWSAVRANFSSWTALVTNIAWT